MDFLLASAVFVTGLIASLLTGVSVIAPLAAGWFCFAGCALYRGFSPGRIVRMTLAGMKKPLSVLQILCLIGLLTAVWRVSGTIPFYVYAGISFISPSFFILCAFVFSCVVGYALGSCFGTSATIGVVLMVLARSGGSDPVITAGAVISGAFFGDRCAPTSSSANLVATLTDTRLYGNIKNMFRTAFIPTVITLLIYLVPSVLYPLQNTDDAILCEIESMFNLTILTTVPALIVLLLPPLGVNVKLAMVLSILAAAGIAVGEQNAAVSDVLRFMITGYHSDAPGRFAKIIEGGGLLSMLRVMSIVLAASTYSGIFDEAGLLTGVQDFLDRVARRFSLFQTALATSFIANMLTCNQSLSVILLNQLMSKIYERHGVSDSEQASHLEDTVILTSGLIPWNIAVATPLVMIEADVRSIPWAVFLWIVPLVNLFPRLRPKIKD